MKLGLTFSDVLIIPKITPLKSRDDADTNTKFTRNIFLKIPFVSSNMASVTEHKMAISMAREGGLGIIHQFGSIEEQINEIKQVKKSTSYIIKNPACVYPDISLENAINILKNEKVTSLLVKSYDDDLIGIFTSKDYLFETDFTKKIEDVMTPRKSLITSCYGISLEEAKEILKEHKIEKLPLIDKSNKIKGLITTKDIKKIEYWPNAARDKNGQLLVGGAVGVKDTIERTHELLKHGVDVIVLDVAHAHSYHVINQLKELKKKFSIDVMVGNIATECAAKDLINAGADGIKVGIGPSSVCTTRIVTGAGIPQLTAIMDVSKFVSSLNVDVPVCADGGMKSSGDICKAICAGASTVYSGYFFSGTDESTGIIVTKDGKRYKKYIGSASYESVHKRKQNENNIMIKDKLQDIFVEGVSSLVDYKGPVEEVINKLLKGLKSGISYCGANNIKEMKENSEFIQITSSSLEESKSSGIKLFE